MAKFRFLILGLCLSVLAGCVSSAVMAPPPKGKDLDVRIAVVDGAKLLGVKIRGPYTVTDPARRRVIKEGFGLDTIVRPYGNGGLKMDHETFGRRIQLRAPEDVYLGHNEKFRRYRGAVEIIHTKDDQLLAVNILGLEDYIRGVLYHEVSHRWPLDVLKAQAVAARTYAVYQVLTNRKREYDVTSDIYSQVYGGRDSERYRTNLAVRRTEGEVLTYNGKILPAFYSATCGGRTEDVHEVWPKLPSIPPLAGVNCEYCAISPHYRWKKEYQLSKDIQEKLNKVEGYEDLWLIQDVAIISRLRSGRVDRLRITDRKGKTFEIAGKEFRHIIGPNAIKSNDYRITMKGYYMVLEGRGWGHGVGMCQWGLLGMARQFYSYQAMLSFYYPGAVVEPIRNLRKLEAL